MSRLKRFTHSLASGYLTLGANILYTFLSVPLALHYLSPAQFGLWALTLQIAGYISLIDMGMSGSVSRMLIDHKDDKHRGEYGGVIKTGALVGAAQGLIILIAGIALAAPTAALLRVPAEFREELIWLIIGQAGILCFSFATRIFQHVLVAHQRHDIWNYGWATVFLLSVPGMWACFAAGWGLFSLLAVQFAGAVVGAGINLGGAMKLKLLPGPGEWGRATLAGFKELFAYASSLFLFSAGMQFINASQTILLTRFMGLEAAALWSVGTRIYTMISTVIWRIHEYSGPPLAEMYVQGERERMRNRLRDVGFLTTNLSIVAGLFLATCNETFVRLWTGGLMQWAAINDLLLALWLVALTTMRGHIALAGATKNFGLLPYILLLEGGCFLGLNILLQDVDGIARLLTISILCTCALSLPFALQRTRNYFGLTWREMAGWYRSSWQLGWRLALAGFLVYWATQNLPPIWRLGINAVFCAALGSFFLLRYGLGRALQTDIAGKLSGRIRRLFLGVSGT